MGTSNIEDDYKRLKQQTDQLLKEFNRAEGQLDGLLDTLRTEFECDSVEQAQDLLAKLQRQELKQRKALELAMSEFEEEWGEILQDAN